jgi:hypothetical protein
MQLPTFKNELKNHKQKYTGGEIIPPIVGDYQNKKSLCVRCQVALSYYDDKQQH